jgi:O-succinylbenzoate synthase
MSREILVWNYQLERKKNFQTKAKVGAYSGALLCVDGGYACIHPWEQYGDLPLDKQLEALKNNVSTPLLEKALFFAAEDKKAREKNESLFAGALAIPPSHALITDLNSLQGDLHNLLREFVEDNFNKIKIKIGARDIVDQIKNLEKLCWAAEGKNLKFRLDFNGNLKPESFEEILSRCSSDLLNRIDFIEDPFVYDSKVWMNLQEKYQIRLALDWYETKSEDGFEVYVVKPARQNVESFCQMAADQMKRVVLTGYMDHPVGQFFAAWEAALAFRKHPLLIDDCGLTTHFLFEKSEFTEQIKSNGAELLPVEGTGIGFDDSLKKLDWKKL